MPRKVIQSLLHDIQLDIQQHYRPGNRYRSVRDVAAHFQVSLQTAHKAITVLAQNGVVVAEQKRGLRVLAHRADWGLVPPKIVLLSNNPDPRFNQAVLRGVQDVCRTAGVEPKLVVNTQVDGASLHFGEWIVGLKADGIIAMSFRHAALPFYYAQTQGVPIVSGIIFDELHTLPAVQHNNTLHVEEAARYFHALGKKRVLCAGYWEPNNKRFHAFRDTFLKLSPRAEIIYAWLAKPESVAKLHFFFMHFQPATDAVFSMEYSANYAVAPYFVSHSLPVEKTFAVFNNEEDMFQFPGLAPVKSFAPSLRRTGRRLAERLLQRVKTGSWSKPLVETI